jgi:hypothetical protein
MTLRRRGTGDFESVPVAAKFMAYRKRPGSRHRPGYRAPSEAVLEHYSVKLQPDTLAAWKETAARMGLSLRQASEYAFRKIAREQGVDVPAHPGPNGRKPPSPDC